MTEWSFGIVFIVTAIVLLLGLLLGYIRGLVRMLLVTVVTVASILLTQFSFPYVSTSLQEHTSVYEKLQESIEEKIEEETENILPGTSAKQRRDTLDGMKSGDQEKFVDSLNLPLALRGLIVKNNQDSVYEKLGVKSFSEYLPHYLATLLVRVIGYVVLFLVFFLILFIILWRVEKIMHLPGLNIINRLLGAALGVLIALVFVWAGYLIITAASSTETGARLLQEIRDNPVTQFLYDNNLLLMAAGRLGR